MAYDIMNWHTAPHGKGCVTFSIAMGIYMNYCLFFLALIVFCAARVLPMGEFNRTEYISKSQTKHIEGLFVVLVLFSHFFQYITTSKTDEVYLLFREHLDQNIVAMFMFYSGFGMMTSFRRKGLPYMQSIPAKFGTLLRNFDAAVILFALMSLAMGKVYTVGHYLKALIAWESVGNSTWYIFAILSLYILFFLSFRPTAFKQKETYILESAAFSVLVMIYGVLMRIAGKGLWWYDTVICFVAGVWYCQFRTAIEKLIMRSSTTYLVSLCAITVAYAATSGIHGYHFVIHEIWILMFTSLMLVLSMKVALNSTILGFFGNHVFSIYILQRIPMTILPKLPFFKGHTCLLLMAVISSTILIALAFEAMLKRCPVPGCGRITTKG